MLLGAFETILGLLMFNTSIKSLKRSAIRKWREAYYLSLFLSLFVIGFGLISLLINVPKDINTTFLFIANSLMFLSLFNISNMKGLNH